jgi:hypothetical protein
MWATVNHPRPTEDGTMSRCRFIMLAAVIACSAGSAVAVPPAEKCEAGKLKQAGLYGFCRLKAEAKAVKSGSAPDYAKCDAKLGLEWAEIETKGGTMCPTSGDQTLLGLFIADHTDNVTAALNGGVLPGRAQRVRTAQETCYDINGVVIACPGTAQDGELQRGLTASFTDNGDGTISDHRTGLMWEKLGDDGSIHDKDDAYTWANAFAIKIATLNATMFAGYADWRLPNLNELLSLASYSGVRPAVHAAFDNGCVAGCGISACSCTDALATTDHWTSTTLKPIFAQLDTAYDVSFYDGRATVSSKSNGLRVRAVRGGT